MNLRNFKPTEGMSNKNFKADAPRASRRKYSNASTVYFTKSDPVLQRVYNALMRKYPPTRKHSIYPNVTQYLKEHAEQVIADCEQ